jgi:hypothetical protein
MFSAVEDDSLLHGLCDDDDDDDGAVAGVTFADGPPTPAPELAQLAVEGD